MNKLFGFFLFAICCVNLQAQSSKNINLVGQLTYTEELSDIWAYVDSNGHEYALVGASNGVSIVDISTDPQNPQEVHYIPGANTIWRDIKTFEDHAYVVNERRDGLLIIDLSDLPTSVSYKDTVLEDIKTAHNLWIDEYGFMYMLGAENDWRTLGGGMFIFDLNQDPDNPVFVGDYKNNYVHDVYVRDNIAYVAEVLAGYLTIIDVSDKANLVVLGRKTYANPLTHNTWLNDAGNICFTTDELDEAYIYAWDVSDPTNITELDKIRSSLSDGKATPHNVHVFNDFLVTSYYHDGLNIIDAQRPANLVEVGYFDTNDLADGGLLGCWGAYPFLPSGLILASDIEEGLFIFQPTYQRACYLEGKVIDAQSRQNLVNVSILSEEPSLQNKTNNLGEYASGTANPGTYDVTFYKYGYWPVIRNVNLSPGTVTNAYVLLKAAPQQLLTIEVVDKITKNLIPDAMLNIASLDDAFSHAYTSNSAGIITDSSIFSGKYKITSGKWGYITHASTYEVDSVNSKLTIELHPGYYDDFIFDFNWQVQGDATTGSWERAEPVGTIYNTQLANPDTDIANDQGKQAFVTGNQSLFNQQNDVDSGKTVLTSPIMDLSSYQNPVLHFHYWFVNRARFGPWSGDDSLKVIVESAGVSKKVVVISGTQSNWQKQDPIFLKDFFPSLGSQVTVRFEVGDYVNEDVLEAAIDQFRVTDGLDLISIDPSTIRLVDFTTYPNPVKNELHISYTLPESFAKGSLSFELLQLNGQRILSVPVSSWEGEVNLPFLYPAGLYFGILRLDNQKIGIQKIIKH